MSSFYTALSSGESTASGSAQPWTEETGSSAFPPVLAEGIRKRDARNGSPGHRCGDICAGRSVGGCEFFPLPLEGFPAGLKRGEDGISPLL